MLFDTLSDVSAASAGHSWLLEGRVFSFLSSEFNELSVHFRFCLCCRASLARLYQLSEGTKTLIIVAHSRPYSALSRNMLRQGVINPAAAPASCGGDGGGLIGGADGVVSGVVRGVGVGIVRGFVRVSRGEAVTTSMLFGARLALIIHASGHVLVRICVRVLIHFIYLIYLIIARYMVRRSQFNISGQLLNLTRKQFALAKQP